MRHGNDESVSRREMGHVVFLCLFLLTAICLSLLPGCGDPAEQTETETFTPVQHIAERGPVKLTVRADRDSLTVGEKLSFSIDIAAEADVDIEMPLLEETHGEFEIVTADTPPDIPEEGLRRWHHTYTLSTYENGELELPGVTIGFTDRRDPEHVITGELISDPLTVTVLSLLQGDPDPNALHDIKDAVLVPISRIDSWLWWTGLLIFLAFAIGGLWRLRRRRDVDQSEPYVPPHIRALLQLDQLQSDGLVEKNEIHTYYFRLSDIIRQYIEGRFSLMAPEQTTEEFLRELQRDTTLNVGLKELLANFLRASDMVKFALHRPSSGDCEEAFNSAGAFVRETARAPDENPDEIPNKSPVSGGEVAA